MPLTPEAFLNRLFERIDVSPTYATMERELEAVVVCEKPIATNDYAHAQPTSRNSELIGSAVARGLSVVTIPYEDVPGVSALYFAYPDQIWRALAHAQMRDLSIHYGWSDALEVIQSRLLGYDESQTRRWLASHRWMRCGWSGQTIYFLLDRKQRDAIRRSGQRSLNNLGPTDVTAFTRPGGFQIRRDWRKRLPARAALARTAIDAETFYAVFGDKEKYGTGAGLLVRRLDPETRAFLERGMVADVELLGSGGWSRRQRT